MNFEMTAYLVRTEQQRVRARRVTRRGVVAAAGWPRSCPRPRRRGR